MINNFNGKYRFLSNFFVSPVEFEGIVYPSAEHAYQAAKCILTEDKVRIAGLATAHAAKKEGRKVKMRPDWDKIKDEVMYKICKEKFHNPVLAGFLLATDNEELVEGNWWGDRYWGKTKNEEGEWEGKNMLGLILMKIRAEIKKRMSKIL